MYITDVAEGDVARIKALIAMEFIRLVKIGKLPPAYQNKVIKGKTSCFQSLFDCFKTIFKFFGSIHRAYQKFMLKYIVTCCGLF